MRQLVFRLFSNDIAEIDIEDQVNNFLQANPEIEVLQMNTVYALGKLNVSLLYSQKPNVRGERIGR